MAELIAKGPFEGQSETTKAGVTLAPLAETPILSLALFKGAEKAAAKVLKPLGLSFPAPNRWVGADDLRLVWTGRDQAFLFGEAPQSLIEGLAGHAAMTDQSSGWAGISVSGAQSVDLLARLYPIDLRLGAFPLGAVAKTGLAHLPSILIRSGAESFEIRVFRSMARSALHDLSEALTRLAARAA